MSKHDSKSQKIQVKALDNKVQGFIEALVAIRMASEDIDLNHPLSLVTKAMLDAATGDGTPVIDLWDGTAVNVNNYRSHEIGGIEYLFRSLIEANTSEPSFDSSLGAWTMTEKFGSIPAFQSSFPPSIGGWVTGDSNSKVYEALTAGNTAAPSGGVTDANWKYIGTYKGSWSEFGFYQIGDVVYDESDGSRRYISNIANNEQPLSDHGGDSTWVLIGPRSFTPDEPLTFTQASLDPVGAPEDSNYKLSFNLPEGKSIVSIERLQDGVISRSVPISNAFTIPANNPNTNIEGFDNDGPQTITIKIV